MCLFSNSYEFSAVLFIKQTLCIVDSAVPSVDGCAIDWFLHLIWF